MAGGSATRLDEASRIRSSEICVCRRVASRRHGLLGQVRFVILEVRDPLLVGIGGQPLLDELLDDAASAKRAPDEAPAAIGLEALQAEIKSTTKSSTLLSKSSSSTGLLRRRR